MLALLSGIAIVLLLISLPPERVNKTHRSNPQRFFIRIEDYTSLFDLLLPEEKTALENYSLWYFREPLGEKKNVWGYISPYKEIGLYIGEKSPFPPEKIFFHELGHVMEFYNYQKQIEQIDIYLSKDNAPPFPESPSETYAEEYASRRLAELGL